MKLCDSFSLRIFSVHTPGEQLSRIMPPAISLYAHSYIKVFIMLKNHGGSVCTGAKMHAPGSENVQTLRESGWECDIVDCVSLWAESGSSQI